MKKIAEKRVAHFVKACRQNGVKATQQRREILRELAMTTEHPDAEKIYMRVRKRLPAISLDTVYRTLRIFEEQDDIFRVATIRDRARFDANTNCHHHFICSRCGRIDDFNSAALDRFTPPPEVAALGRVERIHIEFRGHCRKCQTRPRTVA